jgi:uncharacterized membrane protein required for colicin V production
MDIAAAAVLLLFLILGARAGLVRTLAGLLIVVVALVGAGMIAATFTDPATRLVAPMIEKAVTQKVEEAITAETGRLNVERVDPEIGELLSMLHLDEDVRESIADRAEQTVRETGASVIAAVVESLCRTAIYGLLYILAFLGLWLLLHVLAAAMDLLAKLPGLSFLNALGGAALGLVKGALVLFLAIWAARRLGVSFETEEVARTYILQFFATHTPLSVLSLLQ